MIVCSHCGLEAQMNDRYCKGCGHRFSVTDGDYSGGSLGASTGFATSKGATTFTTWGTASASLANGITSGDHALSASSTESAGGLSDASSQSVSITPPAVAVAVATSDEAPPTEPLPATAGATPPTTPATATPPSVGRLIVRAQNAAPGDEREYLLDGQNITVGRSPSCDVVLDGDQLISRRHALLKFEGGRYVLVDLGSSNGTYINDTEIHEAVPLRDADRILIGEHELTYSTEPASLNAAQTGANARSAFTVAAPPPRTDPHIPAVNPPTTGEEPTVPGPTLEPLAEETTIFIPGPLASAGSHASTTFTTFASSPAETQPAEPQSVEPGEASAPFAVARMDEPQEHAATQVADQPSDQTQATDATAENATSAPASDPWDAFNTDNLPAQPDLSAATVATADAAPEIDAQALTTETAAAMQFAEQEPQGTAQTGEAPIADTAIEASAPLSTTPAPISAPPSMPKPGDSIVDHISAIQDYAQRLRQRTEDAEHLAAQRQQSLAEARARLGAILAEQQRYETYAAEDDGADLTPLIEVARQAAENPRHLDTVTQLSDHAEDILNALQRRQTLRTTPGDVQRALQDLYAWLNRQG